MNSVDSCITVLPGQFSSSEDEDDDDDDEDDDEEEEEVDEVVTGDCSSSSPNLGPPNSKRPKLSVSFL